jgi:hypothetical protein
VPFTVKMRNGDVARITVGRQRIQHPAGRQVSQGTLAGTVMIADPMMQEAADPDLGWGCQPLKQ